MQDDTTNTPKLEVTWTPATCEGLPPVGTRIGIPSAYYYGDEKDKRPRWLYATIREYLAPDDYRRPVEINGNVPWVLISSDSPGYNFGSPIAFSRVALVGIEKQPDGWPHAHERDYPNLDRIRQSVTMTEDAFADLLKAWLKDNGYLKR